MNINIPFQPRLFNTEDLTFVEWLKKKPYDHKWNHFRITEEWGTRLYYLLNNQENLSVTISKNIFIKKFQYFLYKGSSKKRTEYKYYYK